MVQKTSAEWMLDNDFKHVTILDYDGWNRSAKDWEYSWYQELITKQEFERRLCQSTIITRVKDL